MTGAMGDAGMWPWMMWWAMVLFWTVPLLLIGVLGWGLLRARNLHREPPREQAVRKGALDILAERYARSELTREEFLQMKEDLQSPE